MNEQTYQKIWKKTQENLTQEYKIKNGKLYRNNEERDLRVIQKWETESVLYMLHDHPISAHFGFERTYRKAKERYYWPSMRKNIETYVKSCDQCQRRGRPNKKNELHPIKTREPFYQIGIDFVGPLPITDKGNRYILVAVDYFTKWPEAKATKEATAQEVANFIYEDIICRHGCPQRILSDRGSHFNNNMIEELMEKFKIKHGFSTPYHPKTNGLTERFNKTIGESLAKLKTNNNWDEKISSVLLAYRSNLQKSSKVEPFTLVYGRKVKLPIDENQEENQEYNRIEEILEEIPKIRSEAQKQIIQSQSKQKEYHDKKRRPTENYSIGTKVLYYNAAKDRQWSGKLNEKWKGPYYIYKVIMNGSYQLKDTKGRILRTPVNGELLKRYHSRESFEPIVLI